jgi:hypothetical protein
MRAAHSRRPQPGDRHRVAGSPADPVGLGRCLLPFAGTAERHKSRVVTDAISGFETGLDDLGRSGEAVAGTELLVDRRRVCEYAEKEPNAVRALVYESSSRSRHQPPLVILVPIGGSFLERHVGDSVAGQVKPRHTSSSPSAARNPRRFSSSRTVLFPEPATPVPCAPASGKHMDELSEGAP